jgi:serine/threonine-protein kinase
VPVVRRILVDALSGLSAAHDLCDATGNFLGVVHRDVSPHNLIVGADGVTRVTDFGIAVAAGRLASTKADGAVKGKLQYLSPEQVFRKGIDRRTDVFAAGVVGWEALVGRKLFDAGTEGETLAMILREPIHPPSMHRMDVPLDLDETILRALEREPDRRFGSALEFARAIEDGGPLASREEVERLVIADIGETLAARRERLARAGSGRLTPTRIEPLVEDAGTRVDAQSLSHTFDPPKPRGRAVSPMALLVVGSLCVSGGLLVGFSVRATPPPSRSNATTATLPASSNASPDGAESAAPVGASTSSVAPTPAAPVPPPPTSSAAATASVTPKTTPVRRTYGGARRTDAGRGRPFMPDDL